MPAVRFSHHGAFDDGFRAEPLPGARLHILFLGLSVPDGGLFFGLLRFRLHFCALLHSPFQQPGQHIAGHEASLDSGSVHVIYVFLLGHADGPFHHVSRGVPRAWAGTHLHVPARLVS